MNTKVLLAAVAGGVAFFLLGWLVFGILLDPYYKSMMTEQGVAAQRAQSDMILWAVALSNLVYGLLLALIYNRWANISTFQSGAIAGAIISFLITLSFDLGMYAMFTLWTGGAGLIVDPIANAVVGGIAGGVVGWALGFGGRK